MRWFSVWACVSAVIWLPVVVQFRMDVGDGGVVGDADDGGNGGVGKTIDDDIMVAGHVEEVGVKAGRSSYDCQ
jgi:hypothetical protein